jgi:hypothetical protein
MRTTLDIADDVLQAAKERARREGRTAGEIISDLARQALTTPPRAGNPTPEIFHGFELLPHRGGLVTNELVNEIRNEIGE